MPGTIGWSIELPLTAGAWIGHHLDLRFETGVCFTWMLLFAAGRIGSATAWRVLRSHRE